MIKKNYKHDIYDSNFQFNRIETKIMIDLGSRNPSMMLQVFDVVDRGGRSVRLALQRQSQ